MLSCFVDSWKLVWTLEKLVSADGIAVADVVAKDLLTGTLAGNGTFNIG